MSTPHGAWRWLSGPPGQSIQPEARRIDRRLAVGTGLADQFSDLELDCYLVDLPSDLDCSGPVHVLGGELEALWDYDQDEEEWSDEPARRT